MNQRDIDIPELHAALAKAIALLTDVTAILDVVRAEWAAENAWSDWDQGVRDRITAALAEYEAHYRPTKPKPPMGPMGMGYAGPEIPPVKVAPRRRIRR